MWRWVDALLDQWYRRSRPQALESRFDAFRAVLNTIGAGGGSVICIIGLFPGHAIDPFRTIAIVGVIVFVPATILFARLAFRGFRGDFKRPVND